MGDCGKRKIWITPNNISDVSIMNCRQAIRGLITTGLLTKKPNKIHSRSRSRKNIEATPKGRHMGYGKRHGTREARLSSKILWIRRTRVLRRMLRNYRNSDKIEKHLYHDLYLKCKGGVFKNKRVLMEVIHKERAEKKREKTISDQFEARRNKMKAIRERKAAKKCL